VAAQTDANATSATEPIHEAQREIEILLSNGMTFEGCVNLRCSRYGFSVCSPYYQVSGIFCIRDHSQIYDLQIILHRNLVLYVYLLRGFDDK